MTLGVTWKRCAVVTGILGAIVGCNSLFQHLSDESSQGGGDGNGGGLARVDSEFSDAPVSPGGTGGIVTTDSELAGEETRSFFKGFQIDPPLEDSAGPKFVVSADVDQDGLTDLVSGWNQSQPVQLHLQRRDALGNISFRTITIAGTTPVGVMAGVEVGQINEDGWLDIVVLVKATGFATFCPAITTPCTTDLDCNPACATDPMCTIDVQCGNQQAGVCDGFGDPGTISNLDGEILIYFSPGSADLLVDGDRWTEIHLVNPFIADTWIHDQFPGREDKDFTILKTQPEWGGFTSLAVADFDGQPGDDIVVALNPGQCDTLGQDPPTNTVDLWINPGPGLSELFEQWGVPDPNNPARRVPLSLVGDAPPVKDLGVMDVDGDGDRDVLVTYTNSISQNIRWLRNPLIPHQPGGPSGAAAVTAGTNAGFWLFSDEWQRRPIGQLDPEADVMALGDIDGDGFDDIVVRSAISQIVQWYRHPNPLTIQPEFPPNDPVPDRFDFPWPVFTLAQLSGHEPEAIAVGDVTNDGRVEVIIAAAGAVFWYDGTSSNSPYEAWFSNTIVEDGSDDLDQDGVPDTADGCPTDPNKIEPGICGCGFADPDCSTPTLLSATTHINTLLVTDLDGDGRNDVLATLDRRSGSGLSKDALQWYRNIREPDDPENVPTRPSPKPDDRDHPRPR
ncbi:MAG: VCBS repeat-containing protein [Planctomycetota bacterium]